MTRTPFGTTRDGTPVEMITLRNDHLSASFLTLGAVLQDLRLPEVPYGLTLGADTVEAYQTRMSSYGSIMGPIVNRISGACVTIEGTSYPLEANQDGTHTLHTGAMGTHKRVWRVADLTDNSLTLTLAQPHLIDGLPGNRHFTVTYSLDQSSLTFTIEATTDAATLVNFANHSYWNLDGTPTYAGHTLQISADHYLPTTPDNRPTGAIAPVQDAYDFRQPRTLSADDATFYDHNFCLSTARQPLRQVAALTGTSGVALIVSTTEPGLQLYDGGTMGTAPHRGHHGRAYGPYEALALETQFWPDAPTHPHFPSISVTPDTPYRSETRYAFRAGS